MIPQRQLQQNRQQRHHISHIGDGWQCITALRSWTFVDFLWKRVVLTFLVVGLRIPPPMLRDMNVLFCRPPYRNGEAIHEEI